MFLYELLLNWLLVAFLIVIQCAYRDRLRVVWLNICGLVSDGGLGGGFAALITILGKCEKSGLSLGGPPPSPLI